MEDDLVMNRLPLPKYFDGEQWNTVVKPTRKSIPKYLHEDLPQLKHIYIKEKFKQMGKFNCPEIQFFSKMIKQKKPPTQKKPKQKKYSKNKPIAYDEIKDELQYALITTDVNSNIMDNLLNKVRKAETERKKSQIDIKKVKKKRNHSLLARETGKYFGNTVDLVFRQRKKEYLNSLKKAEELDTTEMEKRLNQIKLLDLEG